MSKYVIISDATLDLPNDIIAKYDIKVIPMVFDLDDKTYTHYPDERELSIEEFYMKLKSGSTSVSSQISPMIYEEFFEEFLSAGIDLLYIAFSSGLSGTYNCSRLVLSELAEKYPDRTIRCVDSLCASIGEGALVLNAALKKEEGYTLEQLTEWVEENKSHTRHWFTVKDLFHLRRGGRVSGVEALVGTALKIRPVLSIDQEGKLIVKSKVRGSKKEIEFIASKVEEEAIHPENQVIIIGHGDDLEQAQILEETLRQKGLGKEILISKIGPIIGTHTGPGMLGITFLGTEQ